MKPHAAQFPDDAYAVEQFFVKTGNSLYELSCLYTKSVKRLSMGNFALRSCNMNCTELKNQMKADSNLVKHECVREMILEYEYSPDKDTIQLSHYENNPGACTKRTNFSEALCNFDCLSFCVLLNRVLISEWWRLGCDEPVPGDYVKQVELIWLN